MVMKKPIDILTKDFVTQAVQEGKRSREIARETGLNDRTIRWYFRKYNLQVPKWNIHKVWNKDKKAVDDIRIKVAIEAAHEARRGNGSWNKGLKLPPLKKETKAKISKSLKGKYVGIKSSNWKGEKASYSRKHKWLSAEYNKEGICAHCKIQKPTEWANISQKYLRNRKDYIELCRQCHVKYDMSKGIRFGRKPS